MPLSTQDVEKIAILARLKLTSEEKALYQEQLSAVLEYAERLNQLAIEDVPPTASAVSLQNVMRDDIVEPSLAGDDVLFNAPKHALNQFQIKAVLDNE